MPRSDRVLIAASLVGLLVGACAALRHHEPHDLGSGDAGDLTFRPPVAHTVLVAPNGSMRYDPSSLRIRAGDSVHWVFGADGHTVTSVDGSFCSPDNQRCAEGRIGKQGDLFDHAFLRAGKFPYYCVPHLIDGMEGEVIVE